MLVAVGLGVGVAVHSTAGKTTIIVGNGTNVAEGVSVCASIVAVGKGAGVSVKGAVETEGRLNFCLSQYDQSNSKDSIVKHVICALLIISVMIKYN